jgi:hypothetical protein
MLLNALEVQRAYEKGATWEGILRRSGPVLAANVWADLSYAAGNPVANYYAAAPMTGSRLAGTDGIETGPAMTTAQKYVSRVCFMPPSGTNVGISEYILYDVCQFYPFLDGDGGSQDTIGTMTVNRYARPLGGGYGEGCRIMVVSQGAGIGFSDVEFTYTNSAGTAGRVAYATLNFAAAPGSLASSMLPGTSNYTYPCGPFVALQAGDSGVQSIQNINVLTGAGGIAAVVIVKPLVQAGTVEALAAPVIFAAPVEVDLPLEGRKLEAIDNDAYLGVIMRATTAGTPAITSAIVTTVWG